MSYIFIIETDELLWQINRKLDMHNIIKVCLCVWKEWLFVLQCKSTSIKQSFCTSLCACLYCVDMSFLSNKDKSTLIIMPKPWSTPAVMHHASHTPLSLTSSVSAAFLSLIKTANGSIPLVLTKSVQCIVYCMRLVSNIYNHIWSNKTNPHAAVRFVTVILPLTLDQNLTINFWFINLSILTRSDLQPQNITAPPPCFTDGL